MATKTILLALDVAQADALLARHGGEEVDPVTGEVTRAVERAVRTTPAPRAKPKLRRVIRSTYMAR